MVSVVDQERMALRMPVAFLNEVTVACTSDALLAALARWVPAIIPTDRCSITLVEYDNTGKIKEMMRHLALAGVGDNFVAALPLATPPPVWQFKRARLSSSRIWPIRPRPL